MGLDIVVGEIPYYEGDPDDSDFQEYQKRQYERINSILRNAGLPAHDEPVCSQGGAPWHIRIGSFSCLHYLRRIAAHLWAGNGLAPPCLDDRASRDPVLKRYYMAVNESPNIQFAHLINHSDDGGYYLPIPFDTPLEPGFELIKNIGCQVIGSSFTLMDECEYLADFLELPLDLDPETVREASLGKEKGEAVWERYGVESFVCSALYMAAKVSVESGCTIVLC
jgi:hypothetical protein